MRKHLNQLLELLYVHEDLLKGGQNMNTSLFGRSLVIGIIALCIAASAASAVNVQQLTTPQPMPKGHTLYVGGNGTGPGNYTLIQDAIDNSTNGDTIYVFNGTYHQNLDTKLKKITLTAESLNVNVTGPTAANPVINIGTSEVVLSGFTIIGTTNQIVIKVVSMSENVVISHNVIKNGGYGISLMLTTSRATITDNVITNNAFINIQLQTSTYDVISFNTIENGGGQGISLSLSSSHNSIVNNSIRNNANEGISLDGAKCTDNTISGNNISGNQVGIRFKSAGSNKIKSNIIQDSIREGLLFQISRENTVNANNIINNKRQASLVVSFRNTWDANYWSNWIGIKNSKPGFQKLPKVVHGLVLFSFDLHPAKTPYNITGFP